MDLFDTCIGAVATSLARAVVGGTAFLIVTFLICRLFPRIPAAIRFGVWWLGCAKLLTAFFCLAAIPIVVTVPHSLAPHLGGARKAAAVQDIFRQISRAPASSRQAAAELTLPRRETWQSRDSTAKNEASSESVHDRLAAAGPQALDTRRYAEIVLLAAWAFGCGFQFFGLCRSAASVYRLLRETTASTPPDDFHDLIRRMRLPITPRFRTSSRIVSPIAAGALRPVIVMPSDYSEALSEGEIRSAIAHELAHVKRGDALMILVPALARCFFFFHPLVHLAYRECINCREEACDAAALSTTRADRGQYASLLLKTALGRPMPGVRTAGATPGMAAAHFDQLRRRLEAVRAETRASSPITTVLIFALTTLVGVLPYRVVLAANRFRIAAPQSIVALPTAYTLTDLGTLGGRSSDAMAISEDGQVVGSANNDRRSTSGHGFVYSADSGMRDLGALIPYRHSVASAINSRGTVALDAFDRSGRALSVIWDGKRVQTLRSLPGFRFSRPSAINSAGAVVGTAQNPWPDARGAFRTRAFVYSDGAVRDVGTLGGRYSAAAAINNSGEVVGKADLATQSDGSSITHAFIRRGGTAATPSESASGSFLQDLGTLPGGNNSIATAINDRHVVAGTSEVATGRHHAFRFENGKMEDLGTLSGADASRAYAINKAGAVVGSAYSEGDAPNEGRRAALWIPAGTKNAPSRIVDLNALLPPDSPWVLEAARGINNRGQIVGQGMIGGERRAFLLTPK